MTTCYDISMTIRNWLLKATAKLKNANIDSAQLDAELILMFTSGYCREFLRAHDEEELKNPTRQLADILCDKRAEREPMAYLINHKEFYGRNFYVDKNVLIPRPESEQIIEILCKLTASQLKSRILDVGTGSGILAITAKLKLPKAEVTALDISEPALKVARQNAEHFSTKIAFIQSDLLKSVDGEFDIILANLPYVSPSWNSDATSPELRAEPQIALYASDDGNALNKKLIRGAPNKLCVGGYLIMEMDPEQIGTIAKFAKKYGLREILRKPYDLVLQKV